MNEPDIDFGDADPEDAWEPEDEPDELIHNLFLRVVALDSGRHREEDELVDAAVDEVERRATEMLARDDLSDEVRVRAENIIRDVQHVRARLADG